MNVSRADPGFDNRSRDGIVAVFTECAVPMNDIKNFLKISRQSPVPLHAQVREGLRRWLETVEAGQPLPAERRLAHDLSVDRTTIKKAYNAFVKEGILTRGIKGTFVSHMPGESAEPIHPFALHPETPAHARCALSMAVFENWPAQKIVWERMAERFNASHSAERIAIEWLPPEINTLDAYHVYIREKRPDIVLLSYAMARSLKHEERLAPLPEDLARSLRSERYYAGIKGADDDALLSYVVPIHVGCWGALWNEDLIGDRQSPPADFPGFIQWLIDLGKKLPRRRGLLPNANSLPVAKGVPLANFSKEGLKRYFEDSFRTMARLGPVRDRCYWEHEPLKFRKLFFSGRAACFAGNLSNMLSFLARAHFRYNGAFLTPTQGCLLPIGWICVAIPTDSRYIEQAAEALRFLASAAAQDEITRSPIDAAFLRTSNRRLLDVMRAGDAGGMDASIGKQFIAASQRFDWHTFMYDDARPLFRAVVDGTQTPAEATAMALEIARRRKAGIGMTPVE